MILATGVTINSVVDHAGPYLLLVGVAAGILAYFRTQVTSKTIQNLRDYGDAVERDRDQTARELTDLKTKYDVLEHRMRAVENENTNLRSYVAGTDAINALADELRERHAELIGHYMALEAMLSSVLHTARSRTPAKRATGEPKKR
jgi:septal ring factor EnvC (AmiA/AmiB activator)